MIRFLPIVMVALGLLLVSTSFAAAQTGAAHEANTQEICLEPASASAFRLEDEKLGRCWKQIGLGILVHGCKLQVALPAEPCPMRQPPAPGWAPLIDPVVYEGPSPPLDIPPPRA